MAYLHPALAQIQIIAAFLPGLCWAGAIIQLLPEGETRLLLDRLWRWSLAPITLVGVINSSLFGFVATLYPFLAGSVLATLIGVVGLLLMSRRNQPQQTLIGLIVLVTLFFGLSLSLLLVPFDLLAPTWMTLGMGVDLALLGLAVAFVDAFEEGQRLRYDLLRSLIASACAALLFGGQVGLVALLSGSNSPNGLMEALMEALLFGSIAAAIAFQTLATPWQALLDRVAFRDNPVLQQARAELQASAAALPLLEDTPALAEIDETEFVRLTRRALSHYGDLSRLASSPLTQLPIIRQRLTERQAADQPLERAAELKALLAERIARLKPRDGTFGTTDEWRHYNALYFPYVLGIKPYSRRSETNTLDPTAQQAWEWFATHVPERTLYNWQQAAAKLIASDLRADLAPFGSDSAGHGSRSPAMLALRNTSAVPESTPIKGRTP
ncbi:MAG: hypothetical protein OHK0050_33280 [Roseiflexaceae bacterium]